MCVQMGMGESLQAIWLLEVRAIGWVDSHGQVLALAHNYFSFTQAHTYIRIVENACMLIAKLLPAPPRRIESR